MSRKRKGNKRRWLTVYKVFGIHTLLFIGSLAVLAVTGPVNSGSFDGNPPLASLSCSLCGFPHFTCI